MTKRLQRSFFLWLLFHILEFWYLYILSILSLWFLHESQSQIPLMAKDFGDYAIQGKISEVKIFPFVLVALSILLFRTMSRLLFFYPARIQQKYLRLELMELLENAHPSRYQSYNDGQLYETLFNDFNRLRGMVGFALLQIGNIIIASFIFIPKIREFDPSLLVAFTPLVVSVFLFSLIIYLFQPLVKKEMQLEGELKNFIIESYEAKGTIKNFNAENTFINSFKQKSMLALSYFYKTSIGKSIVSPLVKAGLGTSLLWGAYLIFSQKKEASDLIFFSSFLFLILEPLLFMSWIGIVLSQGYASWGRIKKLYHSLKNIGDEEIINQKNISSDEVYHFVFWDKNIKIPFEKNKVYTLVGDTGVGKSKILKDLATTLEIKKIPYSYVVQEPYLYNTTILKNIFLGKEPIEDDLIKAKNLLKIFNLDILAPSLEEVLNLEIGENGKKISGGQAKRVALIRSLMTENEFILWDDPFSSVDLLLEKDIHSSLIKNQFFKNKTVVFSTHRFTTVKNSDIVILLDKVDGVKEIGSSLLLLENKNSSVGKYFEKQMA